MLKTSPDNVYVYRWQCKNAMERMGQPLKLTSKINYHTINLKTSNHIVITSILLYLGNKPLVLIKPRLPHGGFVIKPLSK